MLARSAGTEGEMKTKRRRWRKGMSVRIGCLAHVLHRTHYNNFFLQRFGPKSESQRGRYEYRDAFGA
ncbi:hypothetical protein U0C82_08865 [Fulvimarina sp. 2208YS6-2-32]|uniref:Uncharacterized protein n=1 Tax=Fulvimarina uroteuthidis TaxID=3098149 RepID=A0ABU5I395_9HYPH|nr:hypothetical protein [Fulvimarina sp. 2208YS6-2-32]